MSLPRADSDLIGAPFSPAVFFIFRFLTGLVGSAFLSVAGGTVSDLYTPLELFPPMVSWSMLDDCCKGSWT